MKSNKNSSFSVGHNLEIKNPQTEIGFPISFSDWEILKQKIERLSVPPKLFNILGSGLLGIFASSFVGYLLLPSGTDKTIITIAISTSTTTFISGWLCLYFDYKTSNNFSNIHKKDVLDEMVRIQKQYVTRE